MTGDGPELTPSETVALLAERIAAAGFAADEYGLGGAAEDLEKHFAALLGKERALFFPTARSRTTSRCGRSRAGGGAWWSRTRATSTTTRATRRRRSRG